MKPAAGEVANEVVSEVAGAYWEPRVNSLVVTVAPGGYAVTGRPELAFTTLLGSCVAACICDPRAGIGGLNHFLLPDDGGGAAAGGSATHAARYGVHAMEMLIAEILKQGGERRRLRAKLFGGANMAATPPARPVGEHNRIFALDFLRREGIPVTTADLGGTQARRIFFRPAANKVLMQVLDGASASRAGAAPASGDAGVFR
jgi:chemotaxis protein CheD